MFGVAEEILPDLRLAELFQVSFITIDAATRFVELDDCYGFACASPLSVEFSEHVAVETL